MVRAFFIFLCVIAFGASGAYYFGAFSAGGDGAQLIFKAPDKVFYGIPFELSIGVGNNSAEVWRDVALSLSLPEGMAFVDGVSVKSVAIKELGMLGEGSLTDVHFKLVAVRAAGDTDASSPSSHDIEARLTYALGKGGAVFEKREEWRPSALMPAITMALSFPETVKSGEMLKIIIDYANAVDADIDRLSLRVEYPEGFIFEKATSEADADNARWDIGALPKGSKGSIVIFGRLRDVGRGAFKASMRRDGAGLFQPIASAEGAIAVEEPPLTVAIDVNDSPEYAARLGETLIYTIAYSFDAGADPKGGITVRAMLLSQLFDFASVSVNDGGSLKSEGAAGAPQIMWRVDNPDAEGGSVSFTVKVKNEYGIKRLSDRNFTLKLRAEVRAGSTVGSAEREIKVSGDTRVEARGYFRDAASLMVNKGVMPPLVGVPTQYTVHWTVKNYATDVKNVVVRAKLPPGVRFVAAGKSTIDAKPAHDLLANEVVWKIDRVSATTGVLGVPPEAVFQIEATPAATMAGRPMPLLSTTSIMAADDFTGGVISGSAPEITTALPDDLTVAGQGTVQN